MKYVRRSVGLVAASAATLLASAGTAVAQQYPPTSGPPVPGTPGAPGGAGATGAVTGAKGGIAFTGSDLTLLWVGLVVLVIGLVFFVATRRRAALRHRGILREAIN
jgi:hypothetical protein